jgi:hypothetical protein
MPALLKNGVGFFIMQNLQTYRYQTLWVLPPSCLPELMKPRSIAV